MVRLYLCEACRDSNHGACELGHPCPPGHYGGSLCRCPCRGKADWGTPEYNNRELQKLIESIMDFEKASKKAMKKNPMQIGGPPKKIELREPKDNSK